MKILRTRARRAGAAATGRRPGSLRALSAVAAIALLAQPVPAASADEPAAPVADLPVPAVDVTGSDRDLGSSASEVVVSTTTADGPRIRKLRARSAREAATLATALDARPGVEADVNTTYSIPDVPAAATAPKAQPSVDILTEQSLRTTVATLGAEALGAQQWGLMAVNAEAAWAITRGSGAVVAVIDSGVDATHPDLTGRTLPQVDLLADGAIGDPNGHGTAVSGVIAASLDGSGIAGLANEVSILPVRVMDATGTGDAATIATGIVAAVDAGASVVNLSLGGTQPNDVLAAAVQYAVDAGVTVVAAGGNLFAEGNPVTYPAALPGVLGVASLDPDGTSSWFSSEGAFIDLTAPGGDILTTAPGGTWAPSSGTSLAAPFVSAAAALVRVANPRFTKARVDTTLITTALDDSSGNGLDPTYGYGLLQADGAARAAATAPYGLQAPVVGVAVKAVYSYSKLYVNVNPNVGAGYWTFRVQRRRADGTWATLSAWYKTYGTGETRTLDLPRGTYRVKVLAKYGYRAAISARVTLAR